MTEGFFGAAIPLLPGDVETEAQTLGVASAALHMFIDTETAGSGFLADRRPKILYERHLFHRATQGRYDATHPAISNAEPGGYLGGAREYTRLGEALILDHDAALSSASWGLGQVLGLNYHMVGFATVVAFVAAMEQSERAQLEAMLAYLKSARLVRYMQTTPPDFAALAGGYNGRGQIAYYAAHLRANYEKWLKPSATHGPVSRTGMPVTFHSGGGLPGGTAPAAPVAHKAPGATQRPPESTAADLNKAELDHLNKGDKNG